MNPQSPIPNPPSNHKSWENPLNLYIREACPNLVAFQQRVRETFFEDFLPKRGHVLPPSLPDVSFVKTK